MNSGDLLKRRNILTFLLITTVLLLYYGSNHPNTGKAVTLADSEKPFDNNVVTVRKLLNNQMYTSVQSLPGVKITQNDSTTTKEYIEKQDFRMPTSTLSPLTLGDKTEKYYKTVNKEILSRFDPELDPETNCTKNDSIVPNVIHWTWFYNSSTTFRFHHYISALSAIRIQRPEQIWLWYSVLPEGPYWNLTTEESDRYGIKFVLRHIVPPDKVFNITILLPEHKSDVQRLKILQSYGGIYMDLDVIILKPLTPLMCFQLTLGQETEDKLNNGIIIATKNSSFISIWYEQYRTFNPYLWDSHNVFMPFKLAQNFSDLIHIEHTTMNRPNWREDLKYLYSNTSRYDWRNNYCVHTWYRYHNKDYDEESIKSFDTTVGELFRYILFGNATL